MAHEGDPVRKPDETPPTIDEVVSIHARQLNQLAGVVHALESVPTEQPIGNSQAEKDADHETALRLEKAIQHALESVPNKKPTNNPETKKEVHARIRELEETLPPLSNGENRGLYLNYRHFDEIASLFKKTGRGGVLRLVGWFNRNGFTNSFGEAVSENQIRSVVSQRNKREREGPKRYTRSLKEEAEDKDHETVFRLEKETQDALKSTPDEGTTNNSLELEGAIYAQIDELERALPPIPEGENRGPYLDYEHLSKLIDLFMETTKGFHRHLADWLNKNGFTNDRGGVINKAPIYKLIENYQALGEIHRRARKTKSEIADNKKPKEAPWHQDPRALAIMEEAYLLQASRQDMADILTAMGFRIKGHAVTSSAVIGFIDRRVGSSARTLQIREKLKEVSAGITGEARQEIATSVAELVARFKQEKYDRIHAPKKRKATPRIEATKSTNRNTASLFEIDRRNDALAREIEYISGDDTEEITKEHRIHSSEIDDIDGEIEKIVNIARDIIEYNSNKKNAFPYPGSFTSGVILYEKIKNGTEPILDTAQLAPDQQPRIIAGEEMVPVKTLVLKFKMNGANNPKQRWEYVAIRRVMEIIAEKKPCASFKEAQTAQPNKEVYRIKVQIHTTISKGNHQEILLSDRFYTL